MSHLPRRRFIMAGAFTSFVAIVTARALGFLESVMVARILGSYEFGILTLTLSLTNIVTAIAVLGVPSALIKFFSAEAARSKRAAKTLLVNATRTLILSGVAVGATAAVVAFFILAPYYQQERLQDLFLLGIVFAAAPSCLLLYPGALQGLGRVAELNKRSIIAAVASLVLGVGLSLAVSTAGAVVAFLISAVLPGALSIRIVRRSIETLPASDNSSPVPMKSVLNYGLPTVFAGLIVLFALYFVSSTLASQGRFSDLGAFAVASVLATGITVLPAAVGVPLLPVLSSFGLDDPRHGRDVVSKAMRAMLFVSVPAVVVITAFSREIVLATYGPAFGAAAPQMLSLLAISSLLVAVTGVIGLQVAGTGRTWWGLALNIVWAAVVLVSAALLIPRFGGAGASESILMGYTALTITAVWVGKRILGLEFGSLRNLAIWGGTLTSAALLSTALGEVWRQLFGLAILAATLFTMIIMMSREEQALAKEILSVITRRKVS